MLIDKDANAIFYDADVPCRDRNAKFIHDGASAHIYTMMQMSPCRYAMMQMTPQTQIIQKFPLFSNRGFLSA